MAPDAEFRGYPSRTYAWYVVGVLTLVYMFSFLDRQILNLLVGPIRADLGISDTQMSVLIGFTFALFYVGFGIPLGRVVDSGKRTSLIAVGFALWSLFTAGCGLANSYLQLLVMRMGVGVGEASLSPAAYSLITDYFPPERRGRAQGVYNMGIFLGGGVALVLGGVVTGLVARRPELVLPVIGPVRMWQLVFIVVGLIGLLVVPIMRTVREPIRQGGDARAIVPLREVAGYMRANVQTYVCHNVGWACLMFSSYGASAWSPTYFIRTFGWSAAEVGVTYGAISAVFGTLGVIGGGWLGDLMIKRGHRDGYLVAAFWTTVLWFPTGIAYLLAPSAPAALVLLAPTVALVASAYSIGPAALMQVTPARMRGQAAAIYIFVGNLIGLGIGPTAVAVCTDYLFRDDRAVGYSLLIVTCAAHVAAAALLWAGRRPYLRSLEVVHAPSRYEVA